MLLENNKVSNADPRSAATKPNVEVLPPENLSSSAKPSKSFNLSKRLRSLSLRAKATLLAMAIGTIPVVAIGAIAYSIANKTITDQVQVEQLSKPTQLAEKVSSFVLERYGDIQVLSNQQIFSNPKVKGTTTSQEKQEVLDKFIASYGYYDSIAVFDLNGNPIAQSSGAPLGNHSDRTYFRKALETGKPVISQPEISKSSGKFVLHFAAPIQDTVTGQTIAIVRSRVPLTNMEKAVASEEIGNEYHILDPAGNIFIAQEKDQVGHNAFKDIPHAEKAHAAGQDTTFQTADISNGGTVEQIAGFAFVKPIGNTPNLGWSVIRTQSIDIAFKAQRELLLALTVGTGITALAVAALAAWLAGRATRPIQTAAAAVEKIGQGELSTRVPIVGEDELARLGSNINTMAAQLQETEALSSLSLKIRQTVNLDEILETVVQEARKLMNAERVVVYRFNRDWSGYLSHESVLLGLPSALDEDANDPCIGQELIEAYRQGRVVVNNDVTERNYHPDHRQLLVRLKVKANLVTPIVQQGRLFGLLVAHHCTQTYNWQQSEIDLLMQLAVQAGYAIGQATSITEKAQESEQKALVSAIALKIRQSLNLDEILSIVVKESRRLLDVERVVVYRFKSDLGGYLSHESMLPNLPSALAESPNDRCISNELIEAYKQGRIVVNNDVRERNYHPEHRQLLERLQIKANLVVPIVQQGQLFGLLVAHYCSKTHVWQPEEIEILSQMAVQAGSAVGQVTFIEQIETARVEARSEADAIATNQKQQKELLQKRALELLMEVDPVSKGDLTVKAKVTSDEIGTLADSYNAIVSSLRTIVGDVQRASSAVVKTAQSNEHAVSQVAEVSSQQADTIVAALKQVQAISESLQGMATRAKQAEQQVLKADRAVQSGDEAMNRTVAGISAIRETVSETSDKVKRLGQASQKISQVVNLISGFTDQTKLLALNAAIEAARAGEEGRGFAVVAEEVRALAQQSASATADIKRLIEEIQVQTKEVVAAMEDGTEQVAAGTQLVEEARQKLTQISVVSNQVNKLVQGIAQTAAVQTHTSTTVSQTMQEVANSAKEASQQSTSVAKSFEQLLDVAEQLQVSVSQFKLS